MGRSSQALERRGRRSGGAGIWSFIGGAALVLIAAGVIINLPDIKRYIKISSM